MKQRKKRKLKKKRMRKKRIRQIMRIKRKKKKIGRKERGRGWPSGKWALCAVPRRVYFNNAARFFLPIRHGAELS